MAYRNRKRPKLDKEHPANLVSRDVTVVGDWFHAPAKTPSGDDALVTALRRLDDGAECASVVQNRNGDIWSLQAARTSDDLREDGPSYWERLR